MALLESERWCEGLSKESMEAMQSNSATEPIKITTKKRYRFISTSQDHSQKNLSRQLLAINVTFVRADVDTETSDIDLHRVPAAVARLVRRVVTENVLFSQLAQNVDEDRLDFSDVRHWNDPPAAVVDDLPQELELMTVLVGRVPGRVDGPHSAV